MNETPLRHQKNTATSKPRLVLQGDWGMSALDAIASLTLASVLHSCVN